MSKARASFGGLVARNSKIEVPLRTTTGLAGSELYRILIRPGTVPHGRPTGKSTRLIADTWTGRGFTSGAVPGRRIMLDVLLDSFGVLVLLGQAALFLATGQIEPGLN